MGTPPDRPYHHGHLRQAMLAAAVDALAESGPARLSLRELARRAGVSHAAPANHVGDKAGLLTAVAAPGYDLLADTLTAADSTRRSGMAAAAAFEWRVRPTPYAARRIGEHVFPLTEQLVDRVIRVDDEAILLAQAALWAQARALVEPAAENRLTTARHATPPAPAPRRRSPGRQGRR